MYIPKKNDDEILLGVYISLPEPYQSYVRNCRINFGDPFACSCPVHITLLPPTVIKKDQKNDFISNLEQVVSSFSSFWIIAKGLSSFIPVSSVAYIPLVTGGNICKDLYSKILKLDALSNYVERFDYYPHITVSYNVAQEDLLEIENVFNDFSACFISSKICVDEVDSDGHSRNIKVISLGK